MFVERWSISDGPSKYAPFILASSWNAFESGWVTFVSGIGIANCGAMGASGILMSGGNGACGMSVGVRASAIPFTANAPPIRRPALPFQPTADLDHCRVFYRGGDDVGTLVVSGRRDTRPGGHPRYTLDGVVVGLCATAGKDDLVGLATKQSRYLAPGSLHRTLCDLTVGVTAGGIAKVIVEIG